MDEVLKKSLWGFAFLLIVVAWISGLFIGLTGDSGLYGAISRQMVDSGNWFDLRINGAPYDQKPHLFFWLAGLGIKLFGNVNWAFKLFPFLFGLSTVYFIYRLGKLLYDELAGKLAALITGTSQIFFLYFMDLHTDTVLQAAVALAVWQLAEYLYHKKLLNFILGFVGTGLAMLSKGPIGAVIPFFFVLFYLLLNKDFKQLFHPKWLLGILLIFIIISPALFHLWNHFGTDGLKFYFIDNNFGRISGRVAGSSTDPFFYIYNILWAYLPWTFIVFYALAGEIISWFRGKKPVKASVSIFSGILILFVVYSIARGKAPNYMLLFIPLLAVVASGRIKNYLQWYNLYTIRLIYAQIIMLVLLGATLMFVGMKIMEKEFWRPAMYLTGGLILIFIYCKIDYIKWNRLLFSTVVIAAVFNLYLNIRLVPYLYSYQGYQHAIDAFEAHDSEEKQLYCFDLEEYGIFFNAKQPVINIDSWEQLYEIVEKPGSWIYTGKDKHIEIMNIDYRISTAARINQRGMNKITPEFLSRKTRYLSLEPNYLIKTEDAK